MTSIISLIRGPCLEKRSSDAFIKYFYRRFYYYQPMSISRTIGRTKFTIVIFAALITVLASFIAVASTATTLLAMTMQPGNQTGGMMAKNMTPGNVKGGRGATNCC
ncbi:MAG: hypothetical protein WCA39_10700 [Nitrososphaeraceae archaeon]